MKLKTIESYHYELNSSTEVDSVCSKLNGIESKYVLIHIISKIHNTVLVHQLEKELKKLFPHAEIIFPKTSLNLTKLNIYTINTDKDYEVLKDLIIEELDENLLLNAQKLQETRIKGLKTYFTDHLTSLPNIYQLRKDLVDNDEVGLIMIKIDNFATINSFYGFVIGDFVIEKVSEFLANKMNDKKIYRHAGAEFIALFEEKMSFYDLKEYLTSLYDAYKNLFVEYQSIKINIEFTLSSCSNINTENILSKVSMAMKYAGDKNLPFWIYEERMHFHNEYEKNLQISSVVREAIEDSRVVPYFQPIVENKVMKITKFECLARLIDNEGSVIPPNLFIDIAKKIKVYNLVTKTIIEKSFKAFADTDYEFNINLSIEDIMSSEIFDFILETLKSSKVASRVTFELLESEAIKDFDKLDRFINEVKRYGAKIAIDDFGSGYSNFAYIIKIDIDYLKIDGSLIADIDTNKNSYLVVESIVEFAKKFNIKTVAEYVHSSSVMDKVKELGIDYSQGFYIDKPSVNLDVQF